MRPTVTCSVETSNPTSSGCSLPSSRQRRSPGRMGWIVRPAASLAAASGQRPSQAGYGIGVGRPPLVTRPATQATARAIARHGLKGAKTSPNSALANGMPTQKMT